MDDSSNTDQPPESDRAKRRSTSRADLASSDPEPSFDFPQQFHQKVVFHGEEKYSWFFLENLSHWLFSLGILETEGGAAASGGGGRPFCTGLKDSQNLRKIP